MDTKIKLGCHSLSIRAIGQLGDGTGVDGVIVDAGDPGTTTQETTSYSVPTMSEWGMIIFMLLAGLGSIYYMRRRRA